MIISYNLYLRYALYQVISFINLSFTIIKPDKRIEEIVQIWKITVANVNDSKISSMI